MLVHLTSRSKNLAVAIIAFFGLLAIAAPARAATLNDYRGRLDQAARALPALEPSDIDIGDPKVREESVKTKLAYVRALLPAAETILLKGQTVEVDNSWLHESLDEYEKSRNDRARQTLLVRGAIGRLKAIAQRIDEMKDAAAASEKDADKARLAEILRRPEYDKSAAQGSAVERLWERFLRWLSGLFPRMKPLQPGTGRALSGIAQVVVVGISVLLIAFLIWKFVPRYLRNRKKKKPKREARIVLGERLEPDQTAADLLEQAEALARAGDLRGAIRKAYIALLCELADRKIISLAQHKTNRDYLMSVRNKAGLYQTMRNLTNSFELHWYGFVPPASTDWEEFRLGCRKAVTSGPIMSNE